MKVPKTFVQEKGSEKALEKVLNYQEDCLFNKKIECLLSSCYKFLDLKYGNPKAKYDTGKKFTERLDYTLGDIENLSKRISLDPPWGEFEAEDLGFYFSALINNVIKENDTVSLTLGIRLSGVGAYLIRGNTIVYGSVGDWTGKNMDASKLNVFGDAKDYTGYEMTNGIIVISGKTGGLVGYQAKGGEIYVNDIESMIAMSCEASVYKKGEKIWPTDPFKMARGKGVID